MTLFTLAKVILVRGQQGIFSAVKVVGNKWRIAKISVVSVSNHTPCTHLFKIKSLWPLKTEEILKGFGINLLVFLTNESITFFGDNHLVCFVLCKSVIHSVIIHNIGIDKGQPHGNGNAVITAKRRSLRRENIAVAAELESVGLAVPQVTKLMTELKNRGYNVRTDIYTVAQAKEEIARLVKEGRKC